WSSGPCYRFAERRTAPTDFVFSTAPMLPASFGWKIMALEKMVTIRVVTVTPQTHRFFNELATAQAAIAAYIIGHLAQAGATARAYTTGAPISQVCFTRQEEIEFEPNEVLGPISRFTWPSVIHLRVRSGGSRPAATPNPTAVQFLMGSLYEHAFITYY